MTHSYLLHGIALALLAGCSAAPKVHRPAAPPPAATSITMTVDGPALTGEKSAAALWAEGVREVNATAWRAFNAELMLPDTKRLRPDVTPEDPPRWIRYPDDYQRPEQK